MTDHDIPINVIVLENYEKQHEDAVDDYISILKDCRTAEDFRGLISMIVSETRVRTLKEILIRRIQQDARALEETKNM